MWMKSGNLLIMIALGRLSTKCAWNHIIYRFGSPNVSVLLYRYSQSKTILFKVISPKLQDKSLRSKTLISYLIFVSLLVFIYIHLNYKYRKQFAPYSFLIDPLRCIPIKYIKVYLFEYSAYFKNFSVIATSYK